MKIKNKSIIITLFITLIFINFVFAEEDKIIISINVIPEGLVDREAYVIGDFFHYNITIFNDGNREINEQFLVNITNPLEQTISSVRIYNLSIKPSEEKYIVPFQEDGKNWDVFTFDIVGTYKLTISPLEKNVKFFRCKLTFENKTCNGAVWSYNRFIYYFDAMPKWQYGLWKKGEEANNKIISANEKFEETNKKLISLTDDLVKLTKELNDATKTIKNATITMLIVALVTLLVAVYGERLQNWLRTFINGVLVLAVIIIFIILLLILTKKV